MFNSLSKECAYETLKHTSFADLKNVTSVSHHHSERAFISKYSIKMDDDITTLVITVYTFFARYNQQS